MFKWRHFIQFLYRPQTEPHERRLKCVGLWVKLKAYCLGKGLTLAWTARKDAGELKKDFEILSECRSR